MAYDSKIYTFEFSKLQKQPKIIIISKDSDENFISPFPNIHHYNESLQECKEGLLSLLDSFPNIFSKNEDNGSVFSEALKMSIEIIKPMGGKLIIIQGNDDFVEDIDREAISRAPSINYYACLCQELLHFHISISIFCHSKCYKVKKF